MINAMNSSELVREDFAFCRGRLAGVLPWPLGRVSLPETVNGNPRYAVGIFMGLLIFYYKDTRIQGAKKSVFGAGNDHISFPACVYRERTVSIFFLERGIKM